MDEGLELMLYELVRAELPETILVSVSHRSTVEQFHEPTPRTRRRRRVAARSAPHQEVTPPERSPEGVEVPLPEWICSPPTLDWGSEWWTSLVWIAKAWAIAAVSTLVILVLIGRFTKWGKQFWRITGAYFTGPSSVKVWLWLAALLLSVIAGVRLDVLFSYQSNDMLTSFQVVAAGLGGG